MSNYCFIGHDAVGAHVARCLEPLGWTSVDDVEDADAAFTYCTSATALEDAYFDGDGLVKRAGAGTLLVDLSSAAPSLARELAAVATVNDLRPVEAPLSVVDPCEPDALASRENLTCFVAGEQADVEDACTLLEAIAGTVERTGSAGTAQLAKAARTVQAASLMSGAVEACALVRATCAQAASLDGIDSVARPLSLAHAPIVAAVASDQFDGTYTLEMFMAEVAAAMTAADDVDLILPQLEAVMHLLEVLAVIGGSEKAPAALALMYRDEQDSAAQGLDWTRAEGLFAEYGHDHDHGYEDDDDDYDYFSGLGYSAN